MVLRRVRNPLPAPPPPSGVPAENIVDAAAFESSINGYRASNKLSSLVTGGGLDSGSQAWSWDMAHNGFRHSVLPAGEGENIYWSKGMWATCADARANAGAVAQQAFDAFRNSPPHNQNMLGGSWTRQGAGLVCIDGSGGAAIYVTSRFSV